MKSLKPVGFLLAAAIVLAAFGACAQGTGLLESPSSAPTVSAQTPISPTQIAEATSMDLPATPAPTVQAEESCLTCHTDKEALQAMAQEEEVAESLSSGEG